MRTDKVTDLVGLRPQAFDDRRQRHDISLLADLDNHAVHDRQSQRQRQLDGHAAAAHRFERDAAAEVLNIRANDVHADAAAGNVGYRLGGGEAGQHDKVTDFIFAELNIRADQALLLGDLEHALRIDAGAVVLDLDDDAAAAMFSRQADHAFFVLSSGGANRRRFDAMVDRIADDMSERIAEAFDDRTIDLGGFTGHFQANLLVGLGRQFAHQARHALEHRADRLGAHRHDAVFQLARMMHDLFEDLNEAAAGCLRQILHDLAEHRLRDHQFADHVDDAIDALELDARGGRGWLGAAAAAIGGFGGRRSDGNRLGNRRRVHRRGGRQRGILGRDGRQHGRRHVDDLEVAIANDKFKHFIDLRAGRRGFQGPLPPEIGIVGFHLGQGRQKTGFANEF